MLRLRKASQKDPSVIADNEKSRIERRLMNLSNNLPSSTPRDLLLKVKVENIYVLFGAFAQIHFLIHLEKLKSVPLS